MGTATISRRLARERKRLQLRGHSGTKPGTLLKSQIPIRIWADWDMRRSPASSRSTAWVTRAGIPRVISVKTLTVTDIRVAWTETAAVKNKAQKWVFAALMDITEAFPFPDHRDRVRHSILVARHPS